MCCWVGVFEAAAERGLWHPLQPGLSVGSIPPPTRAPLPQQHFPEPAMSFAPVPTGPGQPRPSVRQVSADWFSLMATIGASVSPDCVLAGLGLGCRWELGRVSHIYGVHNPWHLGGGHSHLVLPDLHILGSRLGVFVCVNVRVLIEFLCHV